MNTGPRSTGHHGAFKWSDYPAEAPYRTLGHLRRPAIDREVLSPTGSGIILWDNAGEVTVINNLVLEPGNNGIVWEGSGDALITHNIVANAGGTAFDLGGATQNNNIEEVPEFVDADNGDYRVCPGTPRPR